MKEGAFNGFNEFNGSFHLLGSADMRTGVFYVDLSSAGTVGLNGSVC